MPPRDELRLAQQALAQLRESVVITDAQLDLPGPNIVYVNQAFTRMTGWAMEEVVGRNPRFLQGPKTRRQTLDRLRAQLEKGESFAGEDINYRKDGSEFYIDWYIEALRDAQGKIAYYVAVQRDVTERKLLETQLLHAQRLEGIGLLASGIAHDLNNVLAPILIAPQILREQTQNPALEELLTLVETSAQRGVELVRQVLAFARGHDESGAAVQPRHVIDELAKVTRSTFPKAISVVTEVPADTWLVETDPTQLYQLLLNLCVNARDAIAGQGSITVRAENFETAQPVHLARVVVPAGRHVRLSVRDTGSGIAPENLERVFQPFFTTKDFGQGTGLGLATVSVIVKNAGGVIDLETAPGQGTTFTVHLPAAQQIEPKSPGPATSESAHAPRAILLVDDESAILSVMREVLQSAGHTVTATSSGAQAQAAAASAHFDLALVDLLMPGETSGAAIKALQAEGLHVIAMSGLSAQEVSAVVPCAGILQKPFSLSGLLAIVDEAIAA